MWDRKALYVLVEVADDKHVQTHHGSEVWQSDNIQLALDPALASWRALQEGRPAEYAEIGLSRTDLGDEAYRWLWQESAQPSLTFVSQRVGNTTTYEASIPWKELNATPPQPGDVSGFALLVNEDDGDGRDGWLQLYDGIGIGKDPRKFGLLQFVAAGEG